MPRKNTVKSYIANGIYHVYNRGVDKRTIFLDDRDYKTFLSFLKYSLIPPKDKKDLLLAFTLKGSTFKGVPRQTKNFNGKIELFAYCLMPNHFHLLLKQTSEKDIKEFVHSLSIRYSMFFNKRYKRAGALFQSIYKATLVMEDPYLLHISRYIHLNPQRFYSALADAYSSYGDYLGIRKTPWVNPKPVLSFFEDTKLPFLKNITTYQTFVEKYIENSGDYLGEITLEDSDDPLQG